MSEMVERVATAIAKQEGCIWDPIPDCPACQKNHPACCLNAARAAIAAMREPTAAMCKVFDLAYPQYDDPPTTGETYWDLGIDAALKEEPSPSQTS